MKNILAFLIIIFISVNILFNSSFGQVSVRISILTGANVSFHFNLLSKYDNGIVYNDFTKIGITFSDPSGPDSVWQMEIKAIQGTVNGSGANTIDLDRIRVKTTDGTGGTNPALLYTVDIHATEWIELTNAYQQIVDDGPVGTTSSSIVNISWDCGVTNSVTNSAPDFYVVDIDILVSAIQ